MGPRHNVAHLADVWAFGFPHEIGLMRFLPAAGREWCEDCRGGCSEVIAMKIRTFGRSTLLLTAAAVVAACSGEESNEAGDTETECECTSNDDDYCSSADYAMRCTDGCHFTETECVCADCNYCCTNGECYPHDCDDPPECEGENDNYCSDDTTLMECQTFPDEWDNYFEEVDCYDLASCDCGSGCEEGVDGNGSACWCCQTDGGVDAGD